MHNGQGDLELSDLVDRHYVLLYRYAFRLTGSEVDAEDLTQQTFLSAQLGLGQLREFERAKAWLCAILRNNYLKQLRTRGAFETLSLDELPEPAAAELPFTHLFDQDQLQQALNELPEDYRSPIILFYFGDLSYKDIAQQMDVPIGTIMSRLARGKAFLRRRLSPCPASS